MLPLLSDEDVPGPVIDGLRQHFPTIDVMRVQEVGLMYTPDAVILNQAAREGRVTVTRDRSTMVANALDRMRHGMRMAGLIVLAEDINIGKAIQELATLASAGNPGDLDGQIIYIS